MLQPKRAAVPDPNERSATAQQAQLQLLAVLLLLLLLLLFFLLAHNELCLEGLHWPVDLLRLWQHPARSSTAAQQHTIELLAADYTCRTQNI
jgi:hypothetical protein